MGTSGSRKPRTINFGIHPSAIATAMGHETGTKGRKEKIVFVSVESEVGKKQGQKFIFF